MESQKQNHKCLSRVMFAFTATLYLGVGVLGIACSESSKPKTLKVKTVPDAGIPIKTGPVFGWPFLASTQFKIAPSEQARFQELIPEVLRALASKPDCSARTASKLLKKVPVDGGNHPILLENKVKSSYLTLKCALPKDVTPKNMADAVLGNDGSVLLPGPWNLDVESRILIWHQKISQPPVGLLNQSYLKNSQGKTVPAQSYYHFDSKTKEALIVVYPAQPLKASKTYKWINEWAVKGEKVPFKSISQEILLK